MRTEVLKIIELNKKNLQGILGDIEINAIEGAALTIKEYLPEIDSNEVDIPIDVENIASKIGFEIRDLDVFSFNALASITYSDEKRKIYLKDDYSPEKRRCCITHCLGHHYNFETVLKGNHPFTLPIKRDPLLPIGRGYTYAQFPFGLIDKSKPLFPFEHFANVYAGFLLMPYEIISKFNLSNSLEDTDKHLRNKFLANGFGVSLKAVNDHIETLQKIETAVINNKGSKVDYWTDFN